jgi:hypothetical protein
MADETPPKLIQIGPKDGGKKDGFNLVTEQVVSVNLQAKQLEVELLAYDGKTVVLDVADEALEDLKRIKPGDGATIRVVEEGGKRVAKSFRIRVKDPNTAKADAMLLDLKDTHWLNRKYAAESLGDARWRLSSRRSSTKWETSGSARMIRSSKSAGRRCRS